MTNRIEHQIQASQFDDLLLERYWFAPSLEVPLPKHSHAEYQFTLALTDAGEYRYRGSYHPVPVGSLSVIHPDEMHSGCGLDRRAKPAVFYTFYIPVNTIQALFAEVHEQRCASGPFVANPIILDAMTVNRFRRLFQILRDNTPRLKQDAILRSTLLSFFRRHAAEPIILRRVSRSAKAIGRARDYLEAHYAEEVSLKSLAEVAGLSPFYLSRLFEQSVGKPPHQYQLQCRIEHAKRLLLSGTPVSEGEFPYRICSTEPLRSML
jgi:hypothetical protein